jgi:hypothetical protein
VALLSKGSVKGWEFLGELSYCFLLTKGLIHGVN